MDMKHFLSYIFIIAHMVCCTFCEETYNAFANLDEPLDMVDPHSFAYDRISKKMIKDSLYDAETKPTIAEPAETMDNLKTSSEKWTVAAEDKQERIFYARLINLLLSNMDITIKDEQLTVGTLHLEITDSQMKVLNNLQTEKIPLRQIDTIMAEVIKKPSFIFMAQTAHIMDKFMYLTEHLIIKISMHIQTILISAVILIALFLFKKRQSISHGLSICFIIQLIFIISFMITWWQLIEEAEIKLTAAQKQYSEMPIACQPEKMNIWHKIVATVSPTNDCEKYYEALMSNAKLKVTPALALSHLVSTVIVHPVSHIGSVISEFVDNATARLPGLYAWLVRIGLFLCVGVVIIIVPFCVTGASFNIGLGPLFKFGIDCKREKKTKQEHLEYEHRREPVQIILQVPHAHPPPAISTVSESKELKALPMTIVTKEDVKSETDSGKKVAFTEEPCMDATMENEETPCDHCKRNSPKIEADAADN